ncbi:MAG TPA: export ABC transporter ATP-binding protein, partial [Acidimicrobiia bacterium]|nr:export ABC transporter ATP-binding protein [Acidimicrobiia bacterium]
GEGMAVLYTTHYMEEAERLCDRVAIIDEGVIQAEGTRRELISLVGEEDRVAVTGSGNLAASVDALQDISGVSGVSASDGRIEILADSASTLLPVLLTTISEAGGSIAGVEVDEPNLEAVFLHLTGKALRD